MIAQAAANPRAPRLILGVLACSSLVFTAATFSLKWLPWPGLFAAMFAMAAVTSAWAAWDFENERALAFAGASTITAKVMRGGVLLYGKVLGFPTAREFTAGEIITGMTVWWTFAFVLAVLFFRRLAPLASLSRRRGG